MERGKTRRAPKYDTRRTLGTLAKSTHRKLQGPTTQPSSVLLAAMMCLTTSLPTQVARHSNSRSMSLARREIGRQRPTAAGGDGGGLEEERLLGASPRARVPWLLLALSVLLSHLVPVSADGWWTPGPGVSWQVSELSDGSGVGSDTVLSGSGKLFVLHVCVYTT